MRSLPLLPLLLLLPSTALAHASEQGFVLLLPTDLYVAGGAASVALTVLLIALVPPSWAAALFRPVGLARVRPLPGRARISLALTAALMGLVALGLTGPHDPTENLLPLGIWSVFWIFLVSLTLIAGGLWRLADPWRGVWALAHGLGWRRLAHLPRALGSWLALASFLAFAAVLLAHPAPADPERLALMVLSYWGLHMAGTLVFGPTWLRRAEGLGTLLRLYGQIALLARRGRALSLGLPGWQALQMPRPALAQATFMLTALGIGSFDGLNETFWWFGRIGINPLEFPGRSAVVWQSAAGMVVAVGLLIGAYTLCVWLGLRLARLPLDLRAGYCLLAPAILPIALGYHIAHYLPSALVEGQNVWEALGHLTGLWEWHVTTGFFNTRATVQAIWLSQAGAVVLGHVIAILMSHLIALRLTGNHARAAVSQLPLAAFMVLYTLFGLWLLASPRGI
ncbi:hypothetical protein [Pseudooceanicola nanhaiensis]|uniref:hypothetical protein n=1 Tax=Pseudooceanicola nanhaiensis TaxID=375761 RepID=UPI001CD59B67|nr:hypothetical protein [Pseudooceanicola nanhaiensis]MCA0922226.1 hypothetical protein [Pseudooceanicola nanhaiensis]